MGKKKTLSTRYDELSARLEKLEDQVGARLADRHGEEHEGDAQMNYCSLPETPPRTFELGVTPERAAAIRSIGNKWANQTNIHYYLYDTGPFGADRSQHDVVRQAFEVWKDVGIGLIFTEVSEISESELRIGFQPGLSWSEVGTSALTVGQANRTMNFGWRINVPGPNGLDTAVHEIGHALGFKHEHQNPNAGISWNREAVYEYFRRTQSPPWDRGMTDHNILNKIDPLTVEGSDWDPNSIMHYAFARGLIRTPERYQDADLTPQPGLSQKDIEQVRRFYPEVNVNADISVLEPGLSAHLALAAGEQADFGVQPLETRTYSFSTFGRSDTVMVLFEEENGDYRYVKGDDDSGFDRNASFQVRLIRGRTYQLRIRLYYRSDVENTHVMMW